MFGSGMYAPVRRIQFDDQPKQQWIPKREADRSGGSASSADRSGGSALQRDIRLDDEDGDAASDAPTFVNGDSVTDTDFVSDNDIGDDDGNNGADDDDSDESARGHHQPHWRLVSIATQSLR